MLDAWWSTLADRLDEDLAALETQLRGLTGLLRKEHATREEQAKHIAEPERQLAHQRQQLATVIARAVTKHRKVAAKKSQRHTAKSPKRR